MSPVVADTAARPRLALVAWAAILVLITSACGSSSTDTASTDTGSSASASNDASDGATRPGPGTCRRSSPTEP